MSTNSTVGYVKDGKIHSVYVHWDGYVKGGVGEVLLKHYTTQEKVEQLVALGDLSSVYTECTAPIGHTYRTPHSGYSIAYHRDRGDEYRAPRVSICENFGPESDVPERQGFSEYIYVFNAGTWYVKAGDDKFIPVSDYKE